MDGLFARSTYFLNCRYADLVVGKIFAYSGKFSLVVFWFVSLDIKHVVLVVLDHLAESFSLPLDVFHFFTDVCLALKVWHLNYDLSSK